MVAVELKRSFSPEGRGEVISKDEDDDECAEAGNLERV